jgi:hypothetical protein
VLEGVEVAAVVLELAGEELEVVEPVADVAVVGVLVLVVVVGGTVVVVVLGADVVVAAAVLVVESSPASGPVSSVSPADGSSPVVVMADLLVWAWDLANAESMPPLATSSSSPSERSGAELSSSSDPAPGWPKPPVSPGPA